MSSCSRLLCILFVVLFAAPPAGAVDIKLRKYAEVKADVFTLGEVATIQAGAGPQTDELAGRKLFRAPEPGNRVTYQAADIQRYVARVYDHPEELEWSGSDQVRVERAAMTIRPEQVRDILEEFIASHGDLLPEAEIRIQALYPPRPFQLPRGELDVEIIPSDPGLINSHRFTMIFRVDGRVEENLSVRAELAAVAPVVVAASGLRRGHIIRPQDIVVTRQDIASFRAAPFFNADQLVGKKLKRSLRRGSPITQGMVEFPPMVKRGELVTIIARKSGLTITARGIAGADGKENEVIGVRNSQSEKTILCRVDAPGQVVVEF